MLKSYLKIAIRSLIRRRGHTAILVVGLSIGMAACILLLEYVNFELSFDRWHSKADRIYRVVNDRYQKGERVQLGTITYPAVGRAMAKDFPEIANHTRLAYTSDILLRYGNEVERYSNIYYADEHFFEIFDFPLLAKENAVLLDESNEMVLSESLAKKYFGISDGNFASVLGKELFVNRREEPLKVVAVCADPPANSLLQFDLLLPYAYCIRYWGEGADNSWQWSDFYHFLELKPGTDAEALEAKFAAFSEQYFRGEEVSGSEEKFYLQPLNEAHIYSSHLEYEIGKTGNGRAVWSLLIIAFFILFIAWINYVNLSSVRAMERAREVGVRKVIGARKSQLIRQFLAESAIVHAISLVLALQLAQLTKPWIGSVLGEKLSIAQLFSGPPYLLWGFGVFILMGILFSGAYPALLLSGKRVSEVLKGIYQQTRSSQMVRKALVIFQFMASIALIACTMLVYQQIRYMNQMDLGVNTDQLLVINGPELAEWDSTFIQRMNTFKEALTAYPSVKNAATSSRVLGEGMGRIFGLTLIGENSDKSYMSNFINTDYSYAETYGLQPIAGRFFRQTDHNIDPNLVNNVVLNTAAAKMLGAVDPKDVIGKRLRYWDRDWTVVGVLPDFHQRSFHYAIEPIVFIPYYSTSHLLTLRITTNDIQGTIAQIKETYDQFFPANAFEYQFMEERFQRRYEAEQNFGKILLFFTFLAILIACLGLFGLASYTTMLRTKEIGVRKVLGASVYNIISLLSKDFLLLVCIALLLATPVALYFMQEWLQDFAYTVDINWWIFAITGALALLIAFLTVSIHSLRAALSNPVEALKVE